MKKDDPITLEDSVTQVKDWLRFCNRNEIKPWLWDFKNCYSSNLSENSLENILDYKRNNLKERTRFNVTKNASSAADCDKEAFHIYHVLGWQQTLDDVIRGETLNSFTTTFHQAITKSENKSVVYGNIGINPDGKLNDQYPILYHTPTEKEPNYLKFNLIKNNKDGFEKFALLTHTIGNFTVLPHWMNTGRYNFSKDYWDLTLFSLYDFFNAFSETAWKEFINFYYLQGYVEEDYTPRLFWEGHSISSPYPKNKDFEIFLRTVNNQIEQRGKYMIKQLCEKIYCTGYFFYDEIKDIDLTSE